MTNETMADQMESASPDRTQFLLAHMVRIGHLDQMKEMHRYARENDCEAVDLTLAILEAACMDVAEAIRPDVDQLHAVEQFTKTFERTLTRVLALYRISQMLKKGD